MGVPTETGLTRLVFGPFKTPVTDDQCRELILARNNANKRGYRWEQWNDPKAHEVTLFVWVPSNV
jgi:hypothetical protein